MRQQWTAVLSGVLIIAVSQATQALAQTTGVNVITSAEDAFGASVGRESIGLYSASNVRGFSPTRAGNARIDGLYFDQVWGIGPRLRRSTTIRVGISAQGYPFPAPTGIVDYALRQPGQRRSLGLTAGGDSYESAYVEADASIPLSPGLGLTLGGAVYHSGYYNGTDAEYVQSAALLRWTPHDNAEVMDFWQRSDAYDDETGPIYVPAGDNLPPPVERRRFDGPEWADYRGAAFTYGAIATLRLAPDWTVRAGVFRSIFDDEAIFAHLLTGVTPEGAAHRRIIADPPTWLASTSGEIRVTRAFAEGPRLHRLHVNLRGRDRDARYGGGHVLDYGPTRIGEAFDAPEPAYVFGEQSRDRVRQWTAGVAYDLRWRGVGEFGLGLQSTDYRKVFHPPALAESATRDGPLLYDLTAAYHLSDRLVLFGGHARGLEESGTAPNNAINRSQALPAILTSQSDLGLRFALRPGLKLIVGVFEIRKPYFNLAESGLFMQLGDVRNRGVEMSLSGGLTPNLDIVAGAVLLDARVEGEDVTQGRVGERPVGLPEHTVKLNLDWRPSWLRGASLDLGVSRQGETVATRNNRVVIPPRTLVDIGARHRFTLQGRPATLRLSITNLFDEDGFELRGAGAYDMFPGRVISAYLSADF